MRFFFGLIGDEGNRYVVTGLATPTLKSMEDLTDGGMLQPECDWGPESTQSARRALASDILRLFAWANITNADIECFADDILLKMESGQKWMLSQDDIEKWLRARHFAVN